ncbi:STAS-like domain-containing protein [Lederbergia lenta]|uniref:STAS-like domain-containing protein n=1 Tax=Lederbergia lenta TaxID=1467 RepID=UPI0020423461|nr:STAS-like domain-containing protein [Lederbergia lenta]MCM3110695.1 STAS-like domain-containing protein [Lederbergia lenta]
MGRLVEINVLDFVDNCFSNNEGLIIYNLIRNEFTLSNQVVISFNGIRALNSSFVNSAFIELLNSYDFDFIKKNLRFTNSTKQINEMIKSRFDFEVNQRKNLVFT